jgi:hypothetical protein
VARRQDELAAKAKVLTLQSSAWTITRLPR